MSLFDSLINLVPAALGAAAGFWAGGPVGALAGGTLGMGVSGATIAGEASEKASEAAQQGTNAQLQMYFDNVNRMAPWTEAGKRALGTLESNVMAGPGEFRPEEQPGYKFGYQEFVEKPLLQQASATGKLRSGNVLRALSDRAQNYASTQYDSWLNRWLTKMQPLQSLAGLGQTSATAVGQAGTQTGQGIAQTSMAGGNALAAGQINQANALTGGIKGATGVTLDSILLNKIMGGNLFNAGGTSVSPDMYGQIPS